MLIQGLCVLPSDVVPTLVRGCRGQAPSSGCFHPLTLIGLAGEIRRAYRAESEQRMKGTDPVSQIGHGLGRPAPSADLGALLHLDARILGPLASHLESGDGKKWGAVTAGGRPRPEP